jgi:hypothetical protein
MAMFSPPVALLSATQSVARLKKLSKLLQRCRSNGGMALAIDVMRLGLHRVLRKIRQDFRRASRSRRLRVLVQVLPSCTCRLLADTMTLSSRAKSCVQLGALDMLPSLIEGNLPELLLIQCIICSTGGKVVTTSIQFRYSNTKSILIEGIDYQLCGSLTPSRGRALDDANPDTVCKTLRFPKHLFQVGVSCFPLLDIDANETLAAAIINDNVSKTNIATLTPSLYSCWQERLNSGGYFSSRYPLSRISTWPPWYLVQNSIPYHRRCYI